MHSLCEHASKQGLNHREFLEQSLLQEGGRAPPEGAGIPPEAGSATVDQDPGAVRLQLPIYHKILRELTGLGFVERGEKVVLLGPPGVGKPHLAVALAVKAAEAGYHVLFMTLDRLASILMLARQKSCQDRQLQ